MKMADSSSSSSSIRCKQEQQREGEDHEAAVSIYCENCGCTEYDSSYGDGLYYCKECGGCIPDLHVTDMAYEDIANLYNVRHKVKTGGPSSSSSRITGTTAAASRPSHEEILRNLNMTEEERERERERREAYSFESMESKGCADDLRIRYVQGMQLMLQLQCESLVSDHGVSAAICGTVPGLWLRYVAATRVMSDDWPDKVISEANNQQGEVPCKDLSRKKCETNGGAHGQRAMLSIWRRSLKKAIPLYAPLAMLFLVCHIHRYSILPTDIVKLTLEGKMPYISIFIDIDRLLGPPSSSSSSLETCLRSLFKPTDVVGAWTLESYAAEIADLIGVCLPPVNFYAVAKRYLRRLPLSDLKEALPLACRLYEWVTPVELCLSNHPKRLPTRVYVMSLLIILIRIKYNIQGQGAWERGLSKNNNVVDGDTSQHSVTTRFLYDLQKISDQATDEVLDYMKDFKSYLRYCKDVILPANRTSGKEGSLIERFWSIYEDYYADDEPTNIAVEPHQSSKRSRGALEDESIAEKKYNCDRESMNFEKVDDHESAELRKLMSDMLVNGFHYLPPKLNRSSEGVYLQYNRQRISGKSYFVAHADYYILLRACAKVAEVDCHILHLGVLAMEKKIEWYEGRTIQSLISLRDGSLQAMINQHEEEQLKKDRSS